MNLSHKQNISKSHQKSLRRIWLLSISIDIQLLISISSLLDIIRPFSSAYIPYSMMYTVQFFFNILIDVRVIHIKGDLIFF